MNIAHFSLEPNHKPINASAHANPHPTCHTSHHHTEYRHLHSHTAPARPCTHPIFSTCPPTCCGCSCLGSRVCHMWPHQGQAPGTTAGWGQQPQAPGEGPGCSAWVDMWGCMQPVGTYLVHGIHVRSSHFNTYMHDLFTYNSLIRVQWSYSSKS